MKFSNLAISFAFSALTTTAQTTTGEFDRVCAAPTPGPAQAAVLQDAAQPPPLDPNAPARRIQGVNVDTYVHIVTDETNANNFPPSMVDEQIRVMNERFRPHGFNFEVINITRTVNNAWGRNLDSGTPAERAMKAALNQGGYDALNLYFVSSLARNLLGWCYFPQLQPNAALRAIDGCINVASSMPSGGARNYEMGLTAVHEIGHWLGLYHVFSGSCTGPGDFVSDTAHQRNATSGCPAVALDTCPLLPGLDNINNYMDYSYDECMTEFTPGQKERGTNIFTSLRAGNVRFSAPEALRDGRGAIISPQRNCAGEATYMGMRRWTDQEFNVDRCAEVCRATSRYNARHGLPGQCRYFNTYQQLRGGVVEAQHCAMYTQYFNATFANNRGQWQNGGRTFVGIQNSVGVVDLDNDGVPFECL